MSVGLLFSGQGAQRVGMGQSLCEEFSSAAAVFERADAELGWSLKKLCFEGPADELQQTKNCQLALYVHGMAIVEVLRERGEFAKVKSASGLSLGELTALATADVFDFATGLAIVKLRGQLMQEACEASSGAMASLLGGDFDEACALAAMHGVDVANLNCPGQVVVSGDSLKIEALIKDSKTKSFKAVIPLKVAGAYHSALMQGASDGFEHFLKDKVFLKPRLMVFSNVDGGLLADPEDIKQKLVRQITSTVHWEDCFRGMLACGVDTFYECGPGKVLGGLAKRIEREAVVKSEY